MFYRGDNDVVLKSLPLNFIGTITRERLLPRLILEESLLLKKCSPSSGTFLSSVEEHRTNIDWY